MEFFKPDSNYNFIGHSKGMLTFAALSVVVSIALVAVFGLNFGIDFAGGYELQAKFPRQVTEAEINEILAPLNLSDLRVQRYGDEANNEFLILAREHGTVSDETKQALKDEVAALAGGPEGVSDWTMTESGESVHVTFTKPVSEDALKQVFEKRGLRVKHVSKSEREDQPDYRVDLFSIADQVTSLLHEKLGIPKSESLVTRVEFVGPQVGEQLRNQGIAAVLYSLLFILLYVAVRFDFYFAPGAIIALVHDVAVTMGVFAVARLEFNLPAVAAILTLVGYSLNDTIVVYDRVRENAAKMRGRDLASLVNASINQTLSRTVLTGGSTILVIGALLALGGQTIRDFAIALLVGIITGTYSSIAIASPVYIALRERYGKQSQKSGSVVAA